MGVLRGENAAHYLSKEKNIKENMASKPTWTCCLCSCKTPQLSLPPCKAPRESLLQERGQQGAKHIQLASEHGHLTSGSSFIKKRAEKPPISSQRTKRRGISSPVHSMQALRVGGYAQGIDGWKCCRQVEA